MSAAAEAQRKVIREVWGSRLSTQHSYPHQNEEVDMSNGAGSSDYVLKDCCVCVECGRSYKVEDADSISSENYFAHPWDYSKGCTTIA